MQSAESRPYESFRTEIGYALSDLRDQVDSQQLPRRFVLPKPEGAPPEQKKDRMPNLGIYGQLARLGTDFSQLISDLEARGLTQFKYLRSSRSGICFESITPRGNEVIVMLRDNPPARAPIPQQIQSLCCFNSTDEKINIEILPKLAVIPEGELPPEQEAALNANMQKVKESVELQEGPAGTRYRIIDQARRNTATATDGTAFYIDGDGIRGTTTDMSSVQQDPSYVQNDGTWHQYSLYEEEHRAFNSPLHREQGKGIPMEIIEAMPPDGSKTQPISLGGSRIGRSTVRLVDAPERRSSTTPRFSLGGQTSKLTEQSEQSGGGTSTGPLRFPR